MLDRLLGPPGTVLTRLSIVTLLTSPEMLILGRYRPAWLDFRREIDARLGFFVDVCRSNLLRRASIASAWVVKSDLERVGGTTGWLGEPSVTFKQSGSLKMFL